MKNKRKYLAPELNVDTIELEECIAAGSATIKPGGPTSSERPLVEDWKDTGLNENFDWHL